MKKFVALLMSMAMTVSLAACGGNADPNPSGTDSGNASSGSGQSAAAQKQKVSLTMWGAEEDQAMLQGMIETFQEAYAEYADFSIKLGVQSEGTARETVLTDIEAAADVYAFASGQLNDLVKAGALMNLDSMDEALWSYAGKRIADVKAANMPGSVTAAMYDDTLYAFPMTADDGYFLYYDSKYVSAEDAASWDTLLAAADKAGKKVGMTLASGWYLASFFYGAGFHTILNEDGSTTLDWNQSADVSGVEVVQSVLDIAGNSAFLAVADGELSSQIASGNLCAVVSGVWDAAAAKPAFAEGYAATKLPVYSCAGKEIQQGSVAGFKLVGVNAYSKNAGWAALLAEWITNEENQGIRFEKRELGPSNINAASADEVKSSAAIAALGQQSAYGVVQTVGEKYWATAKTFGEMIAQGTLKREDTAGIQKALDTLAAGAAVPAE